MNCQFIKTLSATMVCGMLFAACDGCELLKISYLCTGINNHAGQVGLLRMDFPRVFILMRDYDRAYWVDFDEWKRDLVEVTSLPHRSATKPIWTRYCAKRGTSSP